jgi:hypothetical protein
MRFARSRPARALPIAVPLPCRRSTVRLIVMCHAPQLDERELSPAIIFAPVGWLTRVGNAAAHLKKLKQSGRGPSFGGGSRFNPNLGHQA